MKKSRSQSSGRSGSSSSSRKSTSSSRSKSSSPSSRSTSSSSGRGGSSSSRSNASSSRGSGRSATKSALGSRSNSKSSSNGRASSRSASNGRSATSNRGRAKQSSPREDLHEVLKDSLKDIYYAEKQLVKALKKVSKAATSEELKEAFDNHRTQTEGQIELLEQAFESMEMRLQGKKCPAMDGLIEEANEHIEEMDKGPALDAALIVGAQKIEHYEIAAYGSMKTFARCLGLSDCEQIFDQILQQESETDELLTQVAEKVNMDALSGEGEEEMEMSEMEEE